MMGGHANGIPSIRMNVKCPAIIRIGTRRSPLAIAQATEVRNRLLEVFPELTQSQIELVTMDTTGDRIQNRPLTEIGGKGLFTREIEEALQAGAVDIAVHAMKDMPDTLPDGMVIDCILEREDSRDAFISLQYNSLAALPEGAVLGTSSVRRQAQVLALRPDLAIVPFRSLWRVSIGSLCHPPSRSRWRPARCCPPWGREPSAWNASAATSLSCGCFLPSTTNLPESV
jgi:hypothetical protein